MPSRKYISKLDRAAQLLEEAREHTTEAEDLTHEYLNELGDPDVIRNFGAVKTKIHHALRFLRQLKKRR